MASRYWRVIGLESYSASDLELSALHLYDVSSRVDALAVLTCSHTPVSGSLASLQDSDSGSTCKFSAAQVSSPGFFLQWDMGAGVAKDVSGVRVGSAATAEGFLAACTLQSLSARWDTLGTLGRIQFPGASTLAPLLAFGDADYPSVVLLARADGSDGATTFVDKSSYSRAITARGGAMTSSAVTVFGQPMMYFDGVNDYAECASGPDFSLPGDFTFEAWAYPMLDDATDRWIFGNYSASGAGGLGVGFNGGKPKVIKVGVTGVIVENAIAAPKNNLHYIKVVRSGSTVAMTVNGAASGSYTGGLDFVPSGTARVALGALASAADGSTALAGSFFKGYLAVRLTKGVARSGGEVPAQVFPEAAAIGTFGPFPARSRRVLASTMASSVVPPHTFASAAGIVLARDTEFGGPGTIYGTTKTKGTPNQPAKARVVLLHQRSKLPVRETWSDPVTGNFAFTGIDTTQQFLTLAEDAAGNFRPVAANRLTPEVLP